MGASGEDERYAACTTHLLGVGAAAAERAGCVRAGCWWSLYVRVTLLRRSMCGRGGRVYTERSLRWEVEELASSMSDKERKEPVRCRVRAALVGWGLEKDMVRLRGGAGCGSCVDIA